MFRRNPSKSFGQLARSFRNRNGNRLGLAASLVEIHRRCCAVSVESFHVSRAISRFFSTSFATVKNIMFSRLLTLWDYQKSENVIPNLLHLRSFIFEHISFDVRYSLCTTDKSVILLSILKLTSVGIKHLFLPRTSLICLLQNLKYQDRRAQFRVNFLLVSFRLNFSLNFEING